MREMIETDVAIVGCGPVGAVMANLLGLHGIDAVVLERTTNEHGEPRAFSCDDEGLRIYQRAGLVERLRADMMPSDVVDYTGVGGRWFAELAMGALDFGMGYSPLHFFYQPKLEAVLREGLRRFEGIQLLLGHEVTDLVQDESHVILTVQEHSSGMTKLVRARYVLGCDGSHSTVRKLLGIKMDGLSYEEPWLAVSGLVEEEAIRVPNTRFVCDPNRPTFVGKGAQNDFRIEFMLKAGETAAEMERPETIRRLISPYVDPERMKITRAVVYIFHNAVAERWRVGRAFLLGDAAHQMPPMMGQGLVSGLRDAANLSWKLDLVLRGIAGDKLLESYEQERQPHTKEMADISVQMARVFLMRNRLLATLRDWFFIALNQIPRARRFIRNLEFKPLPVYQQGLMMLGRRADRHAPEGKLFPQAPVRTKSGDLLLLDDLLGTRVAILSTELTPKALQPTQNKGFSTQQLQKWQQLNPYLVKLLPPHLPPTSDDPDQIEVCDTEGTLITWLTQHKAHLVILRPDRFVFAATNDNEQAPALIQALLEAMCDA